MVGVDVWTWRKHWWQVWLDWEGLWSLSLTGSFFRSCWLGNMETSFGHLVYPLRSREKCKNIQILTSWNVCIFFFPFKLLHSCSGFSLHLKKVWSKCVLSNSTWKFCLCYDPLNVLLRTLKLLAIWLNWWKGSTFFFFSPSASFHRFPTVPRFCLPAILKSSIKKMCVQ